eukprot:300698-Chlamydomonas_euryale.AAC.1
MWGATASLMVSPHRRPGSSGAAGGIAADRWRWLEAAASQLYSGLVPGSPMALVGGELLAGWLAPLGQ